MRTSSRNDFDAVHGACVSAPCRRRLLRRAGRMRVCIRHGCDVGRDACAPTLAEAAAAMAAMTETRVSSRLKDKSDDIGVQPFPMMGSRPCKVIGSSRKETFGVVAASLRELRDTGRD